MVMVNIEQTQLRSGSSAKKKKKSWRNGDLAVAVYVDAELQFLEF